MTNLEKQELIKNKLKKEKVFEYFFDICNTAHGSKNVNGVVNYIENFAKKRSLKYSRDEFNNIIVYKQKSKDCESDVTIILQAHTDMVCVKEDNINKDMLTQAIDVIVDEDEQYISADKTSLGADDGIGVSMMLAILDSNLSTHPNLECVFTSDEEIGLIGASNIDANNLKSRIMINLDSEEEGIFTVSCAGGNDTKCFIPIKRIDDCSYENETNKDEHEVYEIKISGLRGGHSGIEVLKGLLSANKFLGEVLFETNKNNTIKIISIQGGQAKNVISNSASCIIDVCKNNNVEEIVYDLLKRKESEVIEEDKNINIEVKKLQGNSVSPMDDKTTQAIIGFLHDSPNGVMQMSRDIKGLAQTSLNLGVISTQDESVVFGYGVRSSKEEELIKLTQRLENISKSYGGKVKVSGQYPAWDYKKDSMLRENMIKVYKDIYKKEPIIDIIHAGLECGIFAKKIKDLDAVSIGPNLYDVHSVNEKADINSIRRVYQYLLEVLKSIM